MATTELNLADPQLERHIDHICTLFDPVSVLMKLACTHEPAIRRIIFTPPTSLHENEPYETAYEIVLTAEFMAWPYELSMHMIKVQGQDIRKATAVAADCMLLKLWKEQYLRKYYCGVLDLPNFLDHLELAEYWPPRSRDMKFLMQFIQKCRELNHPAANEGYEEEWEEKMRKCKERKRKNYHSYESDPPQCCTECGALQTNLGEDFAHTKSCSAYPSAIVGSSSTSCTEPGEPVNKQYGYTGHTTSCLVSFSEPAGSFIPGCTDCDAPVIDGYDYFAHTSSCSTNFLPKPTSPRTGFEYITGMSAASVTPHPKSRWLPRWARRRTLSESSSESITSYASSSSSISSWTASTNSSP